MKLFRNSKLHLRHFAGGLFRIAGTLTPCVGRLHTKGAHLRRSFAFACTGVCLLCSTMAVFCSCEDEPTYAEQKRAERRAISAFIRDGATVLDEELGDTLLHVDPINVISEQTFIDQDSTTDVSRNEYVMFSSSGVYMQIVRKGTGDPLKEGETASILNRYIEYNIAGDSIQSRNNNAYYIGMLDQMTVSLAQGTLTGTFVQGLMKTFYRTSSVPSGWLLPLHYINIGRQQDAGEEIAKVRLIVPHSSGQSNAVTHVYPCFYEITYQRSR